MNFLYLIALVPLVIIAILLVAIVRLRRVVPTNMVHIVQSKKSTVSYGKGKTDGNVYYAWPAWAPAIGVVVSEFPESVFDISLQDYDAYDAGRLPFKVDVRAFFRIEVADTAAQRVSSFGELREQLKAVLQGAVRRILSTAKLEGIMEDRSTLGSSFTAEVNAQLKEWGVCTVKTIEFMDIRDANESNVIKNMMAKEQSRIDMESRVAVAENKQIAELKEIDTKRSIEVQRQDAEQQVGLRTAMKEQHVGIAREESSQAVASSSKVTAERNAEVQRVEKVQGAQIAKEVAMVQAEERKGVSIVAADADKSVTVTNADAQLQSAMKNADGIKAIGEAKGKAEEAMLMAPVTAQLALAKEIGSNESYQQYLITIQQVAANRDVGIGMAEAMAKAEMKVIANGGDMQGGVTNLMDIFSPKGGGAIGGMLASLAQTSEGKALISRIAPAAA